MLSRIVAAAAGLVALAPAAQAASTTVTDCGTLQAALHQAANGDVITIAEGLTCVGGWSMRDSTQITLQGGGAGATLDGGGQHRILSGSSVGQSTIRNLTFRNGATGEGNGGAIFIDGDSPVTITGDTFVGNTAAFGNGGAVFIDEYQPFLAAARSARSGDGARIVVSDNTFGGAGAGDGNSADDSGGGLSLSSEDYPVALTGNAFVANAAGRDGGGARVSTCGTAYDITANTFRANTLTRSPVTGEAGANSAHRGGGLALEPGCTFDLLVRSRARAKGDPAVLQSGNVFDANVIGDTANDQAGGGEYIDSLDARSTDDRFTRNTVHSATASEEFEVEGAGLASVSNGGHSIEGRNLVAAGNAFDTGGEGGGIYVGAPQGSTLTLLDSTVAGNTAADASGLSGGPFDALVLRNTIVAVNHGAGPQIDGFRREVKSSLVCADAIPTDGTRDANANFCTDPLLVDPQGGEVHETAGSPARNAGDDSMVPSDLAGDFEGEARIAEDRVDIGADEFVLRPPIAPPASTPATTAPGQAVSPVTVHKCVSRRGFRIRLRVPHGEHASSALVQVVGTRVAVTVRHQRLTAPVVLRGLPKGTFAVKITVHLRGGKRLAGTRIYHTCAQKRTGSVPKL